MTDGKRNFTLSKNTPIALFVVFLLPLAIATIFYRYHDYLPSAGTTNKGDLIDPARPLTLFAATTLDGRNLSLEDLKGKWTLILVGGKECNLYCEANLFKTRQARLAMGEDISRVQRLYLLPSGSTGEQLQSLFKEHPRLIVASLEQEAQQTVLNTLGTQPEGSIYIIDPLGNVMMHYPKDATAKGMIEDLRHLLKTSRIG